MVIAAFVITVAAAGVLAFAPLTTTVTATAVPADEIGEEETRRQPPQDVTRENLSLVEAQGWGEAAGIAVPVLLVTGLPLVAPSGRRVRILRGASTVLLFSGVALGILSFGIYLLPRPDEGAAHKVCQEKEVRTAVDATATESTSGS